MTMNVQLIKHNNVDGVILPIAYENKKWLENVRRLTKQNKNIIINPELFIVTYTTVPGTA